MQNPQQSAPLPLRERRLGVTFIPAGKPMDPLDATEILVQGARRFLGGDRAASAGSLRSAASSLAAPAAASRPATMSPASSGLRVTILKAEQLLQIVSTAQPTPISRQIAAAAYLMEAQAQQELARLRRLSSETGREWFA